MKNLRKVILLFGCIALFAACKKEVIEIPDSLNKTKWYSYEDSAKLTISFCKQTCEIKTVYNDKDKEPTVETFNYIYTKPKLVMTDINNPENVWSGEVFELFQSSLSILLRNTDKSKELSFSNYDGSSVWKK